MINVVIVKNIIFQEGEIFICVLLIGKILDEILGNVYGLVDVGVDIIEWCVDYFVQVREMVQVMVVLVEICGVLKVFLLLFIFCSKKEGGEIEFSDEVYFVFNCEVVCSGLVDVIDIELFNDEVQICVLVDDVYVVGVKVIMSNYDFYKIFVQEDIIYCLCCMQDLGVDLLKIVVMLQLLQDVFILFVVMLIMKEKYVMCLLIIMLMGKFGGVSWVIGCLFGLVMIFGIVGQVFVLGQIVIVKLCEVMDMFF